MKRFRHLSGNYLQYLRYFMLLSLLLILLLTGMQYRYSSKSIEETAVENANNTLELLKNAHEAVFSQVEKSVESLFTSSLYLDYMRYYNEDKFYTLTGIYDQLNGIVAGNDALKSVCIYYRKYDYTLSSDLGPAPLSYYHDNEFIRSLDDIDFRYRMTVTRDITYTFRNEPEAVITLVRTLPMFYATAYPEAYVLIDVDRSYIDLALKDVNSRADMAIWVLDENHSVLAASTDKVFDYDAYLDNGITQETHSAIRMVHGQDTLVSHATSARNGWIYIYAVPMREITGGLRHLAYAFLLICVAAVLVAVLGSVLLSYRIFKPIRQISEKINSAADPRHDLRMETDRISMHIDAMIARNKTLEQTTRKSNETARERLLAEIMRGKSPSTASKEKVAALALAPEQGEALYVLVLHLHEDAQAQAILSITPQAIGASGAPFHIIHTGGDELAFIVACPLDVEGIGIMGIAQALWGRMEATETAIGISNPFFSVEGLSDACRQARDAADMHLLRMRGVVRYDALDPIPSAYPIALESRVFAAVKRGVRSEIERALEEFSAYAVSSYTNASDLRNAYLQLYCATYKLIWELDIYSGIGEEFNHYELLGYDTVEEMNGHLLMLYEKTLEAVRANASEKHLLLVDEVCAYIDAHAGEDLSYERLADMFSISASTLRKVFKDIKGITVKAFVDRRRLELAKELLLQTDERISDIADQLGFLSTQALSKFFKGMTGITPGEYRERAARAKREL